MYKKTSQRSQRNIDRGHAGPGLKGKVKRPKTGKPKSKLHIKLDEVAISAQLASWRRYAADCERAGTKPTIPNDVREKMVRYGLLKE